MKPHAIRGTTGAELADELTRKPDDTLLEKPRFSAFFATDLDQTLRGWGIDTAIVCGIATNFCVLTTALDAICHDFRTIIVEDATTAVSQKIHEHTLEGYRKSPIYPLLQVMTCDEIELRASSFEL
jgi:nicotinamidase-related amidase